MKTANKKPGFRNKKNFELFLKEIERKGQFEIEEIMGDNYIDTPGFYHLEKKHYNYDIFEFMSNNMGQNRLKELRVWWEKNVKVQ